MEIGAFYGNADRECIRHHLRYLDQHSETVLSKLKRGTNPSDQLLLMGLGWLVREEKLNFIQDKRTPKVSLKGR